MRKFFNLYAPYKLEWQDLRAAGMVLNVVLIITCGFGSAWFGLGIALVGIFKDCTNQNRHVNDFLLHFSSVVLNLYFLSQLYAG